MIVIGLLVVTLLMARSPLRKKIMSADELIDSLWLCVVAGMIGGRIAYVLGQWPAFDLWWEPFAIWQGGFSLMGSIIGVLLVIPWYLRTHRIPILPFLDLIGLYGLLLQSISRLGCFIAGCCFGIPTHLPWGVADKLELTCERLHPTQLYSAGMLFVLFLVLRFIAPRIAVIPGRIIMVYMMFAGAERFIVDYWRGDREYFMSSALSAFSIHQWVSAGLVVGGLIGYGILTYKAARSS